MHFIKINEDELPPYNRAVGLVTKVTDCDDYFANDENWQILREHAEFRDNRRKAITLHWKKKLRQLINLIDSDLPTAKCFRIRLPSSGTDCFVEITANEGKKPKILAAYDVEMSDDNRASKGKRQSAGIPQALLVEYDKLGDRTGEALVVRQEIESIHSRQGQLPKEPQQLANYIQSWRMIVRTVEETLTRVKQLEQQLGGVNDLQEQEDIEDLKEMKERIMRWKMMVQSHIQSSKMRLDSWANKLKKRQQKANKRAVNPNALGTGAQSKQKFQQRFGREIGQEMDILMRLRKPIGESYGPDDNLYNRLLGTYGRNSRYRQLAVYLTEGNNRRQKTLRKYKLELTEPENAKKLKWYKEQFLRASKKEQQRVAAEYQKYVQKAKELYEHEQIKNRYQKAYDDYMQLHNHQDRQTYVRMKRVRDSFANNLYTDIYDADVVDVARRARVYTQEPFASVNKLIGLYPGAKNAKDINVPRADQVLEAKRKQLAVDSLDRQQEINALMEAYDQKIAPALYAFMEQQGVFTDLQLRDDVSDDNFRDRVILPNLRSRVKAYIEHYWRRPLQTGHVVFNLNDANTASNRRTFEYQHAMRTYIDFRKRRQDIFDAAFEDALNIVRQTHRLYLPNVDGGFRMVPWPKRMVMAEHGDEVNQLYQQVTKRAKLESEDVYEQLLDFYDTRFSIGNRRDAFRVPNVKQAFISACFEFDERFESNASRTQEEDHFPLYMNAGNFKNYKDMVLDYLENRGFLAAIYKAAIKVPLPNTRHGITRKENEEKAEQQTLRRAEVKLMLDAANIQQWLQEVESGPANSAPWRIDPKGKMICLETKDINDPALHKCVYDAVLAEAMDRYESMVEDYRKQPKLEASTLKKDRAVGELMACLRYPRNIPNNPNAANLLARFERPDADPPTNDDAKELLKYVLDTYRIKLHDLDGTGHFSLVQKFRRKLVEHIAKVRDNGNQKYRKLMEVEAWRIERRKLRRSLVRVFRKTDEQLEPIQRLENNRARILEALAGLQNGETLPLADQQWLGRHMDDQEPNEARINKMTALEVALEGLNNNLKQFDTDAIAVCKDLRGTQRRDRTINAANARQNALDQFYLRLTNRVQTTDGLIQELHNDGMNSIPRLL